MRIYLDVCCLNRPFDDQTQDRIRLESEAVLLILGRLYTEEWEWLSSEVVDDEIEQTPDPKRRERLQQMAIHAQNQFPVTGNEVDRAAVLQKLGFASMDALHLACAENGKADIFLTTDDKFLRRAVRLSEQLHIKLDNPLHWLVTQQEIGLQ